MLHCQRCCYGNCVLPVKTKHTYVFMQSAQCFCLILNTVLFSQTDPYKSPSIKFYGNLSSRNWADICGRTVRTDRHDEANRCFLQICLKTEATVYKKLKLFTLLRTRLWVPVLCVTYHHFVFPYSENTSIKITWLQFSYLLVSGVSVPETCVHSNRQ
jgi:hypothetical protein